MRKNISTNTPSERRVGYSRAVRLANRLFITGTTAQDVSGKTVGKNLYDQARYIFELIKSVLESENFSLNDVVSLTVYLTDKSMLPEFDKAFKEYFYDIKPTCTLVGISWLVKDDLLIEVETLAEK